MSDIESSYSDEVYIQSDEDEKGMISTTYTLNTEYIDMVYLMGISLQTYCKDNALPIFNRYNTMDVIMKKFT